MQKQIWLLSVQNTFYKSFNNVKTVPINALTAAGAPMTLIDFTLSNGRRFYSLMGNPLAVKGLKPNLYVQWDSIRAKVFS